MSDPSRKTWGLVATRKHYRGDKRLVFGRPTIGPRVYLVKGPSGWSETYNRQLADAALVKLLAPLAVASVVSPFLTKMQLEAREETWADCMEHLAKITQLSADAIPDIVVVAFWGQTILFEQEEGAN
jgi:hypothetical protein